MVADFHTNSTGILAPLNGMLVVGIDHLQPNVQDISKLYGNGKDSDTN